MKLIKFGKESCAPCVELDKWLEKQGITDYEKINPEEDIDMTIKYNISNIPTLILIDKEGTVLKKCVGGAEKNPARYEALLELYKNK